MFLSLRSFHRLTVEDVFQRISADGQQPSDSEVAQFSPDGRFVVFESLGRLTDDDTNDVFDIYLKDLQTGTITRVSADGAQAAHSALCQVSPDGRFVLFQSGARIAPDDTNDFVDVYVKDLQTGAISRLSSDGLQAGHSLQAVFSPDGHSVLFESLGRLTDDDTNDVSDIYMKDLQTGTITRISADGTQAGGSFQASFSPDGSSVVFHSGARITDDDTNNVNDIYLKNLETGAITRVSADGARAGHSSLCQVSPDGRLVLFASLAQIAPDDTNAFYDIYLKDLDTGTITRISAAGTQSGDSYFAALSPDSRFVVFESSARITADDTNNRSDIYLKDRQTGTITRLSVDGSQAGNSYQPQFSPDGRFVVFESDGRLTADDTNDVSDTYLKDLQTGTLTRLSVDGSKAGDSWPMQFSPDGRFILLDSLGRLTADDTNDVWDVYRLDLSLKPYETAVREGRFVETTFSVGAASQVEIAWGDGAAETLTPADGSVTARHAYAATGLKAAVVTVHEGGQGWAVPFLVDLASGQMSRDTTKADTLSGSDGADSLTGDGYANVLIGNGGNDTLDGGAGADRLEGGAGDDVYLVDDASDVVSESVGGGADSVRTTVSYALAGESEVETLTALGSASVGLTGNGFANTIFGNAGANVLHGGGGRDRLFGEAGNDLVYGDGGSDTLGGGAGRDKLYAAKGRANHDMVVFDTRLSSTRVAKQNVDKIYDFGPKYDAIGLDDAVFSNRTIAKYVKKKGGATLDHALKISKSWFRAGDKALDKNDFFIYNAKTHKLYFDADGSGHKAMVEVASFGAFERHTGSLTNKDLFLV